MRKKLKITFYLLIPALFLLFLFLFMPQNRVSSNGLQEPCAFCNSQVQDAQKFYEDSLVMVLYTHKPIFPGHCLIIPKRHVERYEDLSAAEARQIFQVTKKVHQAIESTLQTPSYLLLQKNGQEVNQTVPHVHFHYIPRKTGETSTLKFFLKMSIANLKKPLSAREMQEMRERLKKSMAAL